MNIRFLGLLILGVMLCIPLAFSATSLKGMVDAKQAGEVRVALAPGSTAVPRVGDAVSFTVEMDGLEIEAGAGTVSKVEGPQVWVKVTEGQPNIDMIAVIQASGIGETAEMAPASDASEPVSGPCVYGELMANRGLSRQSNVEEFRRYEMKLRKKSDRSGADAFNLALIYHMGLGGFPKNPAKAKAYYEQGIGWPAWRKGANAFSVIQDPHEPKLMHNLGCMYLNGEGIPADREVARELFRKAEQRGSERSRQMLDRLGQ